MFCIIFNNNKKRSCLTKKLSVEKHENDEPNFKKRNVHVTNNSDCDDLDTDRSTELFFGISVMKC